MSSSSTLNPIPKKSPLVVHSNNLTIQTANDFGTNQLKIFFYIIAQLPKDADSIPAISVDIETIFKLLDLQPGDTGWRFHVKTTLDDLASRLVYVTTPDNELYRMTWFDYIKSDKTGSKYIFQLRKNLEPFLLKLTREFTRYQFAYLLAFKSVYAIKLYDTLQGLAFRGTVDMTLDEFRQVMSLKRFDKDGNIVADKYPTFDNLTKNVIRPAIKEINEKSDIDVDFEALKNVADRRKISGVRFFIKEKKNPPVYSYVLPRAELAEYADPVFVSPETDDVSLDDVLI